MPHTSFVPVTHGFHFDNSFVNVVLNLPDGKQFTTLGRCGGMAFASLDCYFANIPIPTLKSSDFPGTGVPPDGHPVADYIYTRLFDTWISNGPAFIGWTQASDHQTWLRGPGVIRDTKLVEIPKMRALIDAGQPAPLGMIRAGPDDFLLTKIGSNHQIVATGYEVDTATDVITIDAYDNNRPDHAVVLTTNLSDMGTYVNASNAAPWRGFFVENYTYVYPAPLIESQPDWRWCQNCSGLFFADHMPAAGVCPDGGGHDVGASGNYSLEHNRPGLPHRQDDWRWCHRCSGLFFAGGKSANGRCAGGGAHDVGWSGNYSIHHNDTTFVGQANWHWCHLCYGLFYADHTATAGRCTQGGAHEVGASGKYSLAHT